VRRAYEAHIQHVDEERFRLFGAAGVDVIDVTVGEDYVAPLLRFFRRRATRVA
jgi:hypothetical protein